MGPSQWRRTPLGALKGRVGPNVESRKLERPRERSLAPLTITFQPPSIKSRSALTAALGTGGAQGEHRLDADPLAAAIGRARTVAGAARVAATTAGALSCGQRARRR
jgi:hypothetical protein